MSGFAGLDLTVPSTLASAPAGTRRLLIGHPGIARDGTRRKTVLLEALSRLRSTRSPARASCQQRYNTTASGPLIGLTEGALTVRNSISCR